MMIQKTTELGIQKFIPILSERTIVKEINTERLKKIIVTCQDKYEAQKLASLIFIKEGKETFIVEILDVINNEIIISLKDKSAHSVLLQDSKQVNIFTDFIQSVIEKKQKILDTQTNENDVEISKED